MNKTAGIHHISAIVGHPQQNVDFYARVLGLRLVKKTVNFDDPGTYHLYFGNDSAKPGTLITFFPWVGATHGKIGGGQVGMTAYAIPVGALPYWEKRLEKFSIKYEKVNRFGETYLQFEDYHGLKLELVEREEGQLNNWTFGEVEPKVAIKDFAGAVLYSLDPDSTIKTLVEIMGLEKVAEEDEFIRLESYGDIGNRIDVVQTKVAPGRMGVGTVHHIAWRAKDKAEHLEWQDELYTKGYGVTEVKDRNYFDAIYFKEFGDTLFEIATDGPGLTRDETYETMGEELKLPETYEYARDQIEKLLIPIEVKQLG